MENDTTKQPAPGQPERPEWMDETPPETAYALVMEVEADAIEDVQRIEMTREEFIALKQHLAKMRGLCYPAPAPRD